MKNLSFLNPPYCLTSTHMESGEVMLASGDLIAAQVVHMLKKRKTGIAVKPKMAKKARKRMYVRNINCVLRTGEKNKILDVHHKKKSWLPPLNLQVHVCANVTFAVITVIKLETVFPLNLQWGF